MTDRKSTIGFLVFLGDSLISWKSKMESVVSCSSAESQYRALADTTIEIVWLHHLLADLGVPQAHPKTLFCENKSAIHISHNDVFHERTEHIEIDYHLVRHHSRSGIITLPHISTELQLADLLTKSRCRSFTSVSSKLQLLPLPAPKV